MKNPNYKAGSTYVGVIIGALILGVGVTSTVLLKNAAQEQQQATAAGSQRATYATFQQEVTIQGIDPTKILNPMASVATPSSTSFGGQNGSVGDIGVVNNTVHDTNGSNLNIIGTQAGDGTGDRSGGVGVQIVSSGSTVEYVDGVNTTPLAAPLVGVTTPVAATDFPASSWFLLPANPAGTVYRYTTDGSTPHAGSAIWNLTAANSITAANFPSSLNIAAFHADSRYSTSSVTSLSGIRMQLPGVSYARNAGGSSFVFTYSQMVAPTPNGILLSPESTIPGVAYSIRYTIDGSDPRVSGTAITYSGNFVVPFGAWSGSSAPLSANVRASVVSGDARYVASAPVTFALSNSAEQLAPPGFSRTAAGGAVAPGTGLTFTPPFGTARIFSDKWRDPTIATSQLGTSTTIQ